MVPKLLRNQGTHDVAQAQTRWCYKCEHWSRLESPGPTQTTLPSATFPSSTMSVRDQYAQAIIARHHARLSKPDGPWKDGLPSPRKPIPKDGPIKIGIIGAGAAGLYAALIIDSFKDASITYDILDANPMTNRKGGGRLFTHYFTDLTESENDYFVRLFVHNKL